MKPKYMLDTQMCVYLMKEQPIAVVERLAPCYVGDVVISALTLAELEVGVASSGRESAQNRTALDGFLEDVWVAPFGGEAAKTYGEVKHQANDSKLDPVDQRVAAHALSLDVTLVTNHDADFAMYPGLRVENWVK